MPLLISVDYSACQCTHVPPEWPHGTPQQIRLDLWVDDITAAHDKVMALGARELKPAADTGSADNFQVCADPVPRTRAGPAG